ncbi:uncharacterized protein L969DRAFT_83663 [Mixia osmundae IAM 14324]|uniref:SMP-30/Gluconolactonase/LRE-like region domain-containing protein n=1 Tax=Mixia osmundae (strain CBS 9802 / IAM 14324 / JCM 22182 / KY 12970) TaxID=764103 RepID=G7DST0_MIXOS|nr:uncharacterized protein L969DRAFT_83663 [Mixia osmundae IAM 14324]KEI41822.1 hypothetical protein L969DRAFT_83663 [Mixia osmundae IAM 14324]GAA93638.1 hypothetical protein E5Q_00282 [Mixia osmundae IAM 14324]
MHTITAPSEPLFRSRCTLGEGPLYEARTNTLHFVDIGKNTVHHLELDGLQCETDYYRHPVTVIVLRHDHPGFLCAALRGFAYIPARLASSSAEKPAPITYLSRAFSTDLEPHRMFNDGICDARGRFFAGSKMIRGRDSRPETKPGSLFKVTQEELHSDAGPKQVKTDLTIPNGMGFTSDNRTLYLTDTETNRILAFDYDLDTGDFTNERLWVEPSGPGMPDGCCMDVDDHLWSAKFGGAAIERFNPSGDAVLRIDFPTALNITACVFGGKDMATLYVTTASLEESKDDTPENLAKYTESGNLFAIDLGAYGIKGRPRFEFASS